MRARAINSSTRGRIRATIASDAGGVWMQAITLIQFGISSHTLKKEGIKDDRVSRRKRRIDAVEVARVVLAQIARRPHSGQQDNNVTVDKLAQDCVERGLA